MTDPILLAGVAEQLDLLRRRIISPLELIRLHLQQIERQEIFATAWLEVFAEQALQQAGALTEDDLARPLAGIPIACKDLFDIAGMVTTAASPSRVNDPPAVTDSEVVKRLRDAGAILLGKTVLHEFALGATGVNPHFGTPPNPWRTDRLPGGSSSGSAVAVAIGAAPLALGSDTGGSIRVPSAHCGLSGIKPSYGFVSKRGVFELSLSMDHAGPMGRSARDCAIALDVIAGYDPLDPYCSPRCRPRTQDGLDAGISGWKIAVPTDDHFGDLESDVQDAVASAIGELERLGASITPVSIPWAAEAFANNARMVPAEAARTHRQLLSDPALVEAVSPDSRTRLLAGVKTLAIDYQDWLDCRARVTRHAEELLTEFDLLLSPTCHRTAGPLAGADTLSYLRIMAFTGIFDQTGQPSISVPCGFDRQGLPIGLMLTGRRWRDDAVLTAAHAYQKATVWHQQHPPI